MVNCYCFSAWYRDGIKIPIETIINGVKFKQD